MCHKNVILKSYWMSHNAETVGFSSKWNDTLHNSLFSNALSMVSVGYPNMHWGMLGSRVVEVLLLAFDLDAIHKKRATDLF